jgi:hypothetical protein
VCSCAVTLTRILVGMMPFMAIRGGRLATFDRAIPLQAVPGAKPEHLVLI